MSGDHYNCLIIDCIDKEHRMTTAADIAGKIAGIFLATD